MVAKSAVLRARCEEIDRDPSSIQKSTQAMLVAGGDPADLAEQAARFAGRPVIVGSSDAIVDQVNAAYRGHDLRAVVTRQRRRHGHCTGRCGSSLRRTHHAVS